MTWLAALASGFFVYVVVGFAIGRVGLAPRPAPRPSAQSWLIQAGVDVTPRQFSAAVGLSASLGFVIGLGVFGTWWLALIPAAALGVAPLHFYGRRRRERLGRIREAWPDALRDVLSSLGSGASIHQALIAVSRTGPLAIRELLARYPIQARTLGVVPALYAMGASVGDPATDAIVEVLVMAHLEGGRPTPRIVRDLIDQLSEDNALANEIRSDDTEQRLEGRVVLVAPWVVLLVLSSFPGAYRDFYRSEAGAVVVLLAAIWSLFGVLLIRRLRQDSPEPRVFVGPASPGPSAR